MRKTCSRLQLALFSVMPRRRLITHGNCFLPDKNIQRVHAIEEATNNDLSLHDTNISDVQLLGNMYFIAMLRLRSSSQDTFYQRD